MTRTSEAREAASAPARGSLGRYKTRLFASIVAGIVALDVVTKALVQRLMGLNEQREVIGDIVRLTYIRNPGAAFGLHLGEYSRPVFLVLAIVALIALFAMFWFTPERDRARLTALALVCAGAIGNLVDRILSPLGVVDFLDVGIGTVRWPVFNVADIAVTTGAILLAISLWREEKSDGDRA